MKINSTMNSYKSTYVKPNTTENKFSEIFPLKVQNRTIEESNSKVSSDVYKELSSEYDIRNATFNDICNISKKLYEAGEITTKEHMILTFDFDRASKDIARTARNLGYEVSPDFSMYATAADGNGARDWLAEYEARVSRDLKFNNIIGYQNNKKVLNILSKIEKE